MIEEVDFGSNKDIADMLDYYLANNFAEFAVLLTGEWGSGKTFFIKQYIKHQAWVNRHNYVNTYIEKNTPNYYKEYTFCHISLFDIKELTEIDSRIFVQSNTLLSEKSAKMGRLVSWALNNASSLIPYGSAVSAVTGGLGGLLKDFLSNFPENLVLVFDDIERSNIPIVEIFGYCSSMLTINKAKIILLADENKLTPKENDAKNKGNDFLEFKEKIIGKTLCVKSDPKTVFRETIKNFTNKQSVSLIKDFEEVLLSLYDEYEYKNLRVFQYFLYEAEIFLSHIDDEKDSEQKKNICEDILHTLFLMTFMIMVDNLENKEFENYQIQ